MIFLFPQDHFDKRTSFQYNRQGNLVKNSNAIPTIKPLFDEEEYDFHQTDTMTPLPLYSSPALMDHNYADLINNDPNPFNYDNTGASEFENPELSVGQIKLKPSGENKVKPSRKCCAKYRR